ncbi:BTB/POZ domain-containing protein 17-like [Ptychodera flava]|uniref:BTB/POZ domain-containing protein 17-like n=1 Tax=Ptychodera flava TaxID=63121 RepID=UPI00396A414F
MMESRVSHPHILTQAITDLLNRPTWSDLCVVIGDTELRLHKFVLSQNSEKFKQLFNPETAEEGDDFFHFVAKADLHPECSENFGDFLHYFYTGEISLTVANILPVLALSEDFEVELLRDESRQFAEGCLADEHLGIATCVNWYLHDLVRSQDGALLWIRSRIFDRFEANFDDLAQTDEFLKLELDDVQKLAESPDVRVESEYSFYRAVEKWFVSNPREVEKFPQCIDFVRFPLMTPGELAEIQMSCTLYHQFQELFNMYLVEAYQYHFSNERSTFDGVRYTPRCYSQSIDVNQDQIQAEEHQHAGRSDEDDSNIEVDDGGLLSRSTVEVEMVETGSQTDCMFDGHPGQTTSKQTTTAHIGLQTDPAAQADVAEFGSQTDKVTTITIKSRDCETQTG